MIYTNYKGFKVIAPTTKELESKIRKIDNGDTDGFVRGGADVSIEQQPVSTINGEPVYNMNEHKN